MSSVDVFNSMEDLSEDVVTHILKFLPTWEAIATSQLSRQWRTRNLWRSLPDLEFDHFYIARRYKALDRVELFIDFVDKTLKNRTGSGFPIQKFIVRFPLKYDVKLHSTMESKLAEWISYAVSHNATELEVMLIPRFRCELYFGLLNNSCVRDVIFYKGEFLRFLPNLNLGSIRSVSLYRINLTDDTIKDLIFCCKNLESLVLSYCRGMQRLKICSSTLKNLKLDYLHVSSLKIRCPNLCFLSMRISEMDKFISEMDKFSINASASLEAVVDYSYINNPKCWIKLFTQLGCVKRLSIPNYAFELLREDDDDALFDGFVFENLIHLELRTTFENWNYFGMAALLKICPNITTLTLILDCCLKEGDHLVSKKQKLMIKPLEFSIPNLKILNLKNTKGKNIEVLLRLMKKHGAALEKIVHWGPTGERSSIPLY